MNQSFSNILIVDDNQSNLKLLRMLLAKEGYRVRVATNGHMALSSVEVELPDLILLDIRMPDLDGYEVCQHLKADEAAGDIPIIFLSGLKDSNDKVNAFSSGGVDYITKPFEAKEVLARVQTHLTLSRLRQDLKQMNATLEHRVEERTAELLTTTAALQQEIAEHKQAEEKIRQLNAELEHRVRKRTAKLEAANKELKDFAYVVSHDLKTPLRGISRLANWLTQDYADAIDDAGREMAELLIGRVKRMDNLIDGILEYSRIGRITGETRRIDLNILLPKVVDMLMLPRGIKIAIADNLPVLSGDRTRITQLFQNLLSNAVKFMDKPEGQISVAYSDHAHSWQFMVADNGPGIAPRYHEKIFQIFQTLTPRDKCENTGIGLALVKKIVELHGGKVWLESTEGKGCAFYFTLPKSAAENENT